MANFDHEIDVSGLHCPMPILRAKKALANMSSGQVLHIIATDPASANDIPSFVRQTGNDLMEASQDSGNYHYLIRKT
jgi:tRNA 2-thiouridine synthesizing protein A